MRLKAVKVKELKARAQPATNEDPVLSRDDAAHYLGIASNTLKKWAMQRRIAITKVGRLNKFRKSDLDAYLARHRVEAVNG
jgi:excisionase family DNA binding protein